MSDMKITLKPSSKDTAYNSVTIENPSDELNLQETMDLVKAALVAWGFNVETVKEYFKAE